MPSNNASSQRIPQNDPFEQLLPVPELRVTAEFANGAVLPRSLVHADQGGNPASPAVEWDAVPGAKSYMITMFDPDAPTMSGFWHWVVTDIPAEVTAVAAGELPGGAVTRMNEARDRAFTPACPPAGHGPHRYFLTVQALDVPALDLPDDLTPARVHFMVREHVIARGHVFGVWENPTAA